MIPALLSIPIMALAVILQSAVASRLPLLQGTADLILLILVAWSLQERVRSAAIWALVGGVAVAFVSALPPAVPLAGYLILVGMARIVHRQVWKTPMLAMFLMVIAGTLILHGISLLALSFAGSELPFMDSLELITLPSLLLNLLLALPVYTLFKDLAVVLYPAKLEP